MPRPPGLIDKVNYIVDFIQDPCEAPWQVYVETAIRPLGELILVWFDFGIDDVLRGYFRPAGLRSHGHLVGRRRVPPNRRKPGFVSSLRELLDDDLGNIIGKHLPGARIVKARKVSALERTLWIIDSQIQRALFWWMVIDVTTDFLYSWTSLLIRTEYCQNKYNYAYYGEATNRALIPGGQQNISAGTQAIKRRGNIAFQPSHVILPGPGFITFTAEVRRTDIFRGFGHIEIREHRSQKVLDRSTTVGADEPSGQLIARAKLGSGEYELWLVNDSEKEYCLFDRITVNIIGLGAQE